MSVINVTEDNLLSVLATNKELELYPEPYRSNGDMELVISFDVYLNFIQKYLGVDNYLSTPSLDLRFYLDHDMTDTLLRCFYKDIAVGVIKEIWYTDVNAQPTKLTHTVAGCPNLGEAYINGMHQAFTADIVKAQDELLKYMNGLNYKLPPIKTIRFRDELNYASLLYAMSLACTKVGYCRWSLERSHTYASSRFDN